MNQSTQPLRQQLKQKIAREAVALSDNKLQVTLSAYFQGDTSSLSIRNAQKDDRDPHRIEVHALHLVEGLLEKYEAGIAQILDARLAGLHEKYRELAWAGGPGSGAAAEFAGEIAQLRMSLEEWGRYVRPEPAWRRPGQDTPDPFGTKPTAGPGILAPMRIVK